MLSYAGLNGERLLSTVSEWTAAQGTVSPPPAPVCTCDEASCAEVFAELRAGRSVCFSDGQSVVGRACSAIEGVGRLIAFYGSTPAYLPVLEVHGWDHLQPQLNALSKKGEFAEMRELITDAGHWALGLPAGEGLMMYAELLHAAARLESIRVQIAAQAGALVRFEPRPPARTGQAAPRPSPATTGLAPQVPAHPSRSSTGHGR